MTSPREQSVGRSSPASRRALADDGKPYPPRERGKLPTVQGVRPPRQRDDRAEHDGRLTALLRRARTVALLEVGRRRRAASVARPPAFDRERDRLERRVARAAASAAVPRDVVYEPVSRNRPRADGGVTLFASYAPAPACWTWNRPVHGSPSGWVRGKRPRNPWIRRVRRRFEPERRLLPVVFAMTGRVAEEILMSTQGSSRAWWAGLCMASAITGCTAATSRATATMRRARTCPSGRRATAWAARSPRAPRASGSSAPTARVTGSSARATARRRAPRSARRSTGTRTRRSAP